MNKIAAVAASAALALALAGCASQPAASSSASSAASLSASEPVVSASSQSTAEITWTDAKTAADAAKGAGFDKFGVMDEITIDDKEFKDPTFAYAGKVAQANYEYGAIGLIVRKADGSHTAPLTDRDKTEFAQTWTDSIEGLDVTSYGAARGATTVFTWADGTKEYGVTYQGLGGEEVSLESSEVEAIVKAIKEADGAEQKTESDQIAVPNVIGMDAADAAAAIEAAGLSPDGDSEGTVVDQMPDAGTMLDAGDTVSISTTENSTSADAIAVPDVIGMDAPTAAATIENAGLSPDGETEGTVIDQMPAAGTMLDPGDTVSYNTQGYTDLDAISVPNVIGMDAADAAAAIEAAGLSPDGQTEGTVIDQTPDPGTPLDPGETVSFGTDA